MRKSILDELIKGQKLVVLYGARQTGKTSLLTSITNELPYKTVRVNADQARYQEVFSGQDLKKMRDLCGKINSRLIVVYAPDKPHVIIPMISNRIPHEKLKAFLALRKKGLPSPGETVRILLANIDEQENAVRELCEQESIEFLGLTEQLRSGIEKGEQAYYTYDMHFSPVGHRLAAEALNRYLNSLDR